MKPWSVLVLGLLALLPIACQKGKFAEDKTLAETYEIKVIDPKGADATATVEGAGETDEGDFDSKDSGADNDGSLSEDRMPNKGSDKKSGKGSDSDAGDCAAIAGVNKERVKVSGSQKTLTLAPQDAFVLKMSGNTNQVNLKLMAEGPGARLSAVCLIMSGNQSHVTMDIGIAVSKIFIKARGNKALVEATVGKGGTIENLQVDARGNQPRIVLQGEGKYPCDQAGAVVSCPKP